MLLTHIVSLFAAGTSVSALASRDESSGLFSLGTYWKSGSDEKLKASMLFGSQGTQLDVVMDLGSQLGWVYTYNNYTWGSPYMAGPFNCNITATPYFDASLSTTASITERSWREIYGGSSKTITGSNQIQDTVTILNPSSPEDQRPISLNFNTANLTKIRKSDVNCTTPPAYNSGIFGLHSLDSTDKTDIRSNIRAQGLFNSSTMSIFLRNTEAATITSKLNGEILLGGIDTSAFTGDLVVLNGTGHDKNFGYSVPVPSFSVGGRQITVGPNVPSNGNCMLDTGAATDTWPIPFTDPATGRYSTARFLNETGLIQTPTYYAYPGLCADIPADKTFDFTWPSKSGSRNITIKVPVKNYARGPGEYNGNCMLNFDVIGCTFGQTFLAAVYLAIDDDNREMAFAQVGSREGSRIAIPAGGKFPGAVY